MEILNMEDWINTDPEIEITAEWGK